MTVEQLIDRYFPEGRRVGKEYRTRCPAHDDHDPSLSISEGRDGAILLKCRSQECPVEEICAASGISISDLFGNNGSKMRPKIVATYDYCDESGKLLYQNCRYEPKDFRMRKPNGAKSWTWALGDVRRVPYNLAAILAADSVFIVEGEKDCQSAEKLGFVATNSKHWRQEFAEFLRGKRVAIIADADKAGGKIALDAVTSLAGKTSSLRLFELPGSKDLSDWVATGGTREALIGFIETVPEWKQPQQTNPDTLIETEIQCIRASEVVPRAIEWLWENRIPLKKLNVFFGMPDVGKTAVAIDATARGTNGLDWPDCKNTLGKFDVLWLVSEDDLNDTIVPRLMAAGADLTRVHFALRTIISDKAKRAERQIALDTDLAAIERLLEAHPAIKLVVIDPLGSYLGSLKKNAEEAIRPVLLAMKEMAERRGVAIISIDHFNKNFQQTALHRISGTGALSAVPRAVWCFVKDTEDEKGETRLMLNAKLNIVAEAKKAGLKFRFESIELMIEDKPQSLPIVVWGAESSASLDDVLNTQADPKEKRTARAERFLTEYLEDGKEHLAAQLYKDAKKHGISRSALWQVKDEMSIRSENMSGHWFWSRGKYSDDRTP
jgi:putative DNA primase/helicase